MKTLPGRRRGRISPANHVARPCLITIYWPVLVKDRFRLDQLIKDQVDVPAKVEDPKHYGMHRHFTDAGCVLLYGGGMKRGHLHGLTADERPCKTIKDRVVIEDLHASIYRAVGISPKLAYEIEKRPFYTMRNGEGNPVLDLFA